jgi:hypothetical protein
MAAEQQIALAGEKNQYHSESSRSVSVVLGRSLNQRVEQSLAQRQDPPQVRETRFAVKWSYSFAP